ncbi:hypothetical protein TCON_0272 [Astathelohania contejeani]|uniref:Uncharacterized protein n=1 Tax=Astathelohania contejeani TaxID=164912 RepID=A0ABQ7I248_9MICR|nr:hypothetical protein TCON_0272 [Thelohania contejeani]
MKIIILLTVKICAITELSNPEHEISEISPENLENDGESAYFSCLDNFHLDSCGTNNPNIKLCTDKRCCDYTTELLERSIAKNIIYDELLAREIDQQEREMAIITERKTKKANNNSEKGILNEASNSAEGIITKNQSKYQDNIVFQLTSRMYDNLFRAYSSIASLFDSTDDYQNLKDFVTCIGNVVYGVGYFFVLSGQKIEGLFEVDTATRKYNNVVVQGIYDGLYCTVMSVHGFAKYMEKVFFGRWKLEATENVAPCIIQIPQKSCDHIEPKIYIETKECPKDDRPFFLLYLFATICIILTIISIILVLINKK